jgi:1,4-dihydroxy-2-naphthoyl-CoA hydrolase
LDKRGYCTPLNDSAFGIGCFSDDDLDLLESLATSWSPSRNNGTKNWIKGKPANLSRGFEMDLLTRLKEEPLPFAALLGIEIVSAAPDKIVAEMTVRDELCTRPAVLHGGAIMAFADTLGALGTLANLMDGVDTTTIESKTNFIGAAPLGARIVGEATPMHRGRRTMVWQTRVTRADGKLVAMVTQTQLLFPKISNRS